MCASQTSGSGRKFFLQWGRNFFVTEINDGTSKTITFDGLQWGRNFFVTEIILSHIALSGPLLLQWGRNFFVTEIVQRGVSGIRTKYTFNGAVTFSLRKCASSPLSDRGCHTFLQWGRNFFVTEIVPVFSVSRSSDCLQWGRNFFVTEIEIHDMICNACHEPSMGP